MCIFYKQLCIYTGILLFLILFIGYMALSGISCVSSRMDYFMVQNRSKQIMVNNYSASKWEGSMSLPLYSSTHTKIRIDFRGYFNHLNL